MRNGEGETGDGRREKGEGYGGEQLTPSGRQLMADG